MGWMSHRKWKEIKQLPSMLPGPAVPGSCLASFHFQWAIHPIRPVQGKMRHDRIAIVTAVDSFTILQFLGTLVPACKPTDTIRNNYA